MGLEGFDNIDFKKRDVCAVCGTKLDIPLISLPDFPLTGIYVKENKERVGKVNQEFHLCEYCGHGQISNIINPDILYGTSYSFRTSVNATATKANDSFLSFINKVLKEKKLDNIVEVGCSDLYLLDSLKEKVEKIIGIDPILKGREEELSSEKVIIIGDFLENINLREYVGSGKNAIICSHTLEHLHEPKEIIRKLLEETSRETLFFFHFPVFEGLIRDIRFEQIFHQHLHYFSLYSFNYLLESLGAEIVDFEINHSYWGSLLIAFKKKSSQEKREFDFKKITPREILEKYREFKKKMRDLREIINLGNKKIYGYGAGAMIPALAYHIGIDFSDWEAILDDDREKDSLFYLGFPVQIRTPKEIDDFGDSKIIITAIDNSRKILPKAILYNPEDIILLINHI